MDVQEALKLLRYRLGREVSFRPVGVRGGLPVYRVDGRLLSEREILAWVASLRRAGRIMNLAARKRIAEAQRRRWAEYRAQREKEAPGQPAKPRRSKRGAVEQAGAAT